MRQLNQLLAVFIAALLFTACSKVQQVSHLTTATTTTTSQDDLVPTPAGLLPRSHVHFIERGNALLRKNGHVYKVERESGNILEDFGAEGSAAGKSGRQFPGTTRRMPVGGAEPTSWVTNAVWPNTGSGNITSLTTNFTVPALPQVQTDGQTLFLFEGLQNDTLSDAVIVQPILQWGPNPYQTPSAGYWGIANWFVWDGSTQAAVTDLIDVAPGTNLGSSLTYEGKTMADGYQYQSAFFIPSTGVQYDNYFTFEEGATAANGPEVTIPIPQMQYAFETLEAYHNAQYGVFQPADYPAGQNFIDMNSIVIDVNNAFWGANWIADNDKNSVWGENTQVIADDVPAGLHHPNNSDADIHIYWHQVPTINNVQTLTLTTTQTNYPLSAFPGTTVYITLNAEALLLGKLNGTTTATLNILTSGVTFANGSTSFSVTNGTAYTSVTMPAGSGLSTSISVQAYYTSNSNGARISAVSLQ
jgi:hypothetical protein